MSGRPTRQFRKQMTKPGGPRNLKRRPMFTKKRSRTLRLVLASLTPLPSGKRPSMSGFLLIPILLGVLFAGTVAGQANAEALREEIRLADRLIAALESENAALRLRLETEKAANATLRELNETRRAESAALREALAAKNEAIAAKDDAIAAQEKLIADLKKRRGSLWKRLGDVAIGAAVGAIFR